MEPETVQAIAGFTSTIIFASSKIPMLLKAFITRDMESYSLGHIALSKTGNAIYWLYVFSLPVGPIWFLQGFFTLADVLMLLCLLNGRRTGLRKTGLMNGRKAGRRTDRNERASSRAIAVAAENGIQT